MTTEERHRREAVEHIIQASAKWGWQMARDGWREPPELNIEWDRDGSPHIRLERTPPPTRDRQVRQGAILATWRKILSRSEPADRSPSSKPPSSSTSPPGLSDAGSAPNTSDPSV